MHKASIVKIILIFAGLSASGVALAGGRGLPSLPLPLIVKATMDARENVLIITGHHFGRTPPTVTLAGEVLNVKRFSAHEVVATLPHDLSPATYGITVITNDTRHRAASNLFGVALPVGTKN